MMKRIIHRTEDDEKEEVQKVQKRSPESFTSTKLR